MATSKKGPAVGRSALKKPTMSVPPRPAVEDDEDEPGMAESKRDEAIKRTLRWAIAAGLMAKGGPGSRDAVEVRLARLLANLEMGSAWLERPLLVDGLDLDHLAEHWSEELHDALVKAYEQKAVLDPGLFDERFGKYVGPTLHALESERVRYGVLIDELESKLRPGSEHTPEREIADAVERAELVERGEWGAW